MARAFNQGSKLVLSLILSFASFAQASPKLLNSPARPTVEMMKAEYPNWPTSNPYVLQDYHQFGNSQMQTMKTRLAQIIAQLEKAYPGATYAGLGRDSALLVDAIDAFYQSIGQKGRAVHLNASGTSFSGANDEMILRFLQTSGLNLEKLATDPAAPGYIMFDGTRFTTSSQSRILLKTIYRAALARGYDLKKLNRRVTMVSTAFDGYKYYPRNLIRATDLDTFFARQDQGVTADGPQEILSLDAWDMTHGWEWHSNFSSFTSNGERVTTQPGAANSQAHRQAALADMYELITYVSKPEFLESVRAESVKLGVEFHGAVVSGPKPTCNAVLKTGAP